ncbi:MAG: helix-turn-helix transcriptional regulator [Clostridia bacterium]|nr:helix-turn-helix transcriptional regulator [Clostridia bacterium]
MKGISLRVGYENENYFYAVFRKKYGMTPTAYRKNCVHQNLNLDAAPKT